MSDQNSWGGVIAAIVRSVGNGLQMSAGQRPTTATLPYTPLPRPAAVHPDDEDEEHGPLSADVLPHAEGNNIAAKSRLMEDIPLTGDLSRWYRR